MPLIIAPEGDGVPLASTASSAGTYTGSDAEWPSGGTSATVEVAEADGSPDVHGVTKIIVSNGTLTDNADGSVTIATGTLTGAELNTRGGQSVIKAHGATGSTETFDPADGNVHTATLDASCTFTLTAPSGTGACTLELRLSQDGTGGRTVTWPGSVTLVGTLDTTASTTSAVVVETLDGGTTWTAWVVGGSGSGGGKWAPLMAGDGAGGWSVVTDGDGNAILVAVTD